MLTWTPSQSRPQPPFSLSSPIPPITTSSPSYHTEQPTAPPPFPNPPSLFSHPAYTTWSSSEPGTYNIRTATHRNGRVIELHGTRLPDFTSRVAISNRSLPGMRGYEPDEDEPRTDERRDVDERSRNSRPLLRSPQRPPSPVEDQVRWATLPPVEWDMESARLWDVRERQDRVNAEERRREAGRRWWRLEDQRTPIYRRPRSQRHRENAMPFCDEF